ncbi:Beta-lactamase-like protein 2 [Onygenales sp. PD_12]|nr:Beta-lactamase-like protein 2 [Onygenales sp. PD_12]KAK2805184.1 Beta-lactamase-like protein 2 [Onygenales sp. PD_10]
MATQLPPLSDVERLSDRVIRILGGNPGKFTLQGTNTYLIGHGPSRLLIDTGEGRPIWSETLKSVLAEEQATVQTALLTHWHPDHIRGVPDLLTLCPDAKVHKNQPDSPGQLAIEDGQVFKVDGATLRAYHTPGHAKDHTVFVLEEEDAMFTGDNVLGHGTSVFEDLPTYIASLEKMQSCFSGRAYPAHGAVIADGNAKIVEYIQHRQQRENEVLYVLKYGVLGKDGEAGGVGSPLPGVQGREAKAWTPMELVKVIYRDVPENLHVPAASGVGQVLKKLEGDGKVVREGGERFKVVL